MKISFVITTSLLIMACSFSSKLFGVPAMQPSEPKQSINSSEQPTTEISATDKAGETAVEPSPETTTSTPMVSQTNSSIATYAETPPSTTELAQKTPLTKSQVVASPIVTSSPKNMDRVERRRLKAEKFANNIDSLVASHNFLFMPNSMQELPSGSMQMIYAGFYYVGLSDEHVEVHLPVVRGGVFQYIDTLNFNTFGMSNYRANRTQYGWDISFVTTSDGSSYVIMLSVSTFTGETILTLLTPTSTMRYVGYLSTLEGN